MIQPQHQPEEHPLVCQGNWRESDPWIGEVSRLNQKSLIYTQLVS